jgi:hypothetical protein
LTGLLLLALARAPLSAAEKADCAGAPPAQVLAEAGSAWAGAFARGGEGSGLDELSESLLSYAECRARLDGSQRPCAELKGVFDRNRDPLDGACQEDYMIGRFAFAVLRGLPDPLAPCAELIERGYRDFELFPGRLKEACGRLAAAYRAAYAPVCYELAWGGWLNPGYNPQDFFLTCESSLYVTSPRSCLILRDPRLHAQCLERAAAFAALKSGRAEDCGGRPACLAYFGGGFDACAPAWKQASLAYCRWRAEAKP